MDNEKYMKRCYELASQAGKKGFDTFGALLVHNGEALEEAENTADDIDYEWLGNVSKAHPYQPEDRRIVYKEQRTGDSDC